MQLDFGKHTIRIDWDRQQGSRRAFGFGLAEAGESLVDVDAVLSDGKSTKGEYFSLAVSVKGGSTVLTVQLDRAAFEALTQAAGKLEDKARERIPLLGKTPRISKTTKKKPRTRKKTAKSTRKAAAKKKS